LTFRKCHKCGAEYSPLASNQKYCSPECRPHKPPKPKRHSIVCVNCGTSVATHYPHQRYCSKDCRYEFFLRKHSITTQ
jgi:hypothetical protein